MPTTLTTPRPGTASRETFDGQTANGRRVRFAATVAALVGATLVAAVAAVAFGQSAAALAPVSPVRAVAVAVPSISVEHTSTVATTAPDSGTAPRSAAPKAKPKARAAAQVAVKPKKTVAARPSAQRFSIRIGSTGYEPSVVTARTGSPITLNVGKGVGCAAGFVLGSLHIEKDNSSGPVTVRLGRLKAGTYRFTCGMGMVEGRLIVR